eukprot:gene53040-64796_t
MPVDIDALNPVSPIRVLVLGGAGFIGRHAAVALHDAGARVTIGSRDPSRHRHAYPFAQWQALRFEQLLRPEAWTTLIRGFDVVVNCVGILREQRPGDYERLHHLAPAALFAACEHAGIKRVIHLSALGSASDAPTAYWRSKAAGERALARHPALDASIVRPSLVYAGDGASSKLFLALATLPAVALPAAHSARVQPVHIDDLCAALLALLALPMAHSAQPSPP